MTTSPNTNNGKSTQTASLRQWIRLTIAYALIPAVLFLCAGDPGWWQAWAHALLIVGAGVGGRIWAEHRHPGMMAERQSPESVKNAKPWDKLLAPLMAVSVSFPMVIVAGLDHRFAWSPEFPLWLTIIGLALVAAGYAFASWALAENKFFSSVVRIQTERGHTVCDTGPYRFVRHPGYAGNLPALLGIVLALESPWTLIPAALALAIAITRTALEDQTLYQELPGYPDYAQRVPWRLVPGIY